MQIRITEVDMGPPVMGTCGYTYFVDGFIGWAGCVNEDGNLLLRYLQDMDAGFNAGNGENIWYTIVSRGLSCTAPDWGVPVGFAFIKNRIEHVGSVRIRGEDCDVIAAVCPKSETTERPV